jgi:tetratricopeptide (TPR) repeat protein
MALLPADQPHHPLYLITSAHAVFAEGNLPRAREIARQALRIYSEAMPVFDPNIESKPAAPSGHKSGGEPEPEAERRSAETGQTSSGSGLSILQALVPLFLDLSLPAEAGIAAQIALSLQPGNPELLADLAQSSRLAGETYAAVEAAHLAVALDSGNLDFRRELAASLEAAGDWQAALAERSTLLDNRFSSPESGKSGLLLLTCEPWLLAQFRPDSQRRQSKPASPRWNLIRRMGSPRLPLEKPSQPSGRMKPHSNTSAWQPNWPPTSPNPGWR